MASPPIAPPRGQANPFTEVRTIGLQSRLFEDFYHSILVRPWWQFILYSAAGFLLINAVFACLYWIAPGAIANTRPDSFEDAFYFSVQTLATIGYGGMVPITRYAHCVVTLEAFIGILTVAVITGLTFSKFARPSARVMFSAKIAAPTRRGVPHLMFRMANRRRNMVVEAQLRVLMLVAETTPEGETSRRPLEVKLVRSSTAVFALSWTAMHEITPDSPFYGEGALDKLRAQGAEVFLTLSGIDETFAQNIHARYRYSLDDIAWNMRFADVLVTLPDGKRVLDFTHFDDVVPINPVPAAPAATT